MADIFKSLRALTDKSFPFTKAQNQETKQDDSLSDPRLVIEHSDQDVRLDTEAEQAECQRSASNAEKVKNDQPSFGERAVQFARSKIEEVSEVIEKSKPKVKPEEVIQNLRLLGGKALELGKPKNERAVETGYKDSNPSFNAEDQMLEVFPPMIWRDDLRLVVIEPSEHAQAVPICTLKTARLGSHPVFEAVSWAWGERWQDTQVPIYFQQREWMVPKNLYDALVHLRRTDRSRTIWIDALCINQGTFEIALEERAQQIRLMRYIYSFASHAIIWMGIPREETAGYLLEALENGDLVEASHIDCDGIYTMLNEVFKSPWWGRLWVLQESSLPEMCSIQYGHISVSFRSFLDNLRTLEYYLNPGNIDSEAWKLKMNIHRFIRLYTVMQKHATASGILEVGRRLPWDRDEDNEPGINRAQLNMFLTILSDARHQFTTDPRDKIYGLLGFIDDSVARLVEPSYNEEAAYIYTRTCGLVAYNTQSLRCLSMVAKKSKQSNSSLPTWVPDWQKRFSEQEISRDANLELIINQMHLPAESDGNNSIEFDGLTALQARGLKVDKISLVSGEMPVLAAFPILKIAVTNLWAIKLYALLGRQINLQELPGSGAFWKWYNQKLIDMGSKYVEKKVWQLKELERMSGVPPAVDEDSFPQSQHVTVAEDEATLLPSQYGQKIDWRDDMKYVAGGSFFRAYWKTLFHGIDPMLDHVPDGVPVWDKLARTDSFEIADTRDQYSELSFQHLRKTMENRKCFLTIDGFLGNASDAAEGDVVYLLRGARLPVVLRPNHSRPGTYKFVGECYVPGVMRSDKSAWVQASERRRRWIQQKTTELGPAGLDLLDIPTDRDLEEIVILE